VSPRLRSAALVLLYVALGWLAVWGPWQLAVAAGSSKASNPVDGMRWISAALLVVVGALGGAVAPRQSPWLAMATMGAFPLMAFVDMLRDPTSHNLWPIEFGMYAAMSLLAVAGAAVVASIRRRRGAPPDPPATAQ
jgi:hypothetical protein